MKKSQACDEQLENNHLWMSQCNELGTVFHKINHAIRARLVTRWIKHEFYKTLFPG